MKPTKSKNNVSIRKHNEDSWEQYKNNPHIQKNKISKEFWCVTCNLDLGENQGGAGGHSRSKHKITLKGEPIQEKTINKGNDDLEKTSNTDNVDNEFDAEFQRRQVLEEQELDVESTESMILHDIYKDVVKSVAKVGRDVELLYEYERLKTERRIPHDWDFHMWIKMAVLIWNRWHGISIQFNQDLRNVRPDVLEWQRQVYRETLEWENEE